MKIKQYTLSCLLTFAIFNINAQTGIIYKPTEVFAPHPSAILHLEVGNLPDGEKKGFLMPRLNLASTVDVTTVLSPINGVWIYNLSNTTDPDPVFADFVYKWNGATWDRYYTKEQITDFIVPSNYYLKSTLSQTLSGTPLTTFNGGSQVIVSWNISDVVLTNNPKISRINDTEFEVNEPGIYDITGYFSYHPQLASTANSNIRFILQIDRGTGWQNYSATTKTIENFSGTTHQSVALPATTISLQSGNKIRFAFLKTGSNHGDTAGIKSATGVGTKSIRISFKSEI